MRYGRRELAWQAYFERLLKQPAEGVATVHQAPTSLPPRGLAPPPREPLADAGPNEEPWHAARKQKEKVALPSFAAPTSVGSQAAYVSRAAATQGTQPGAYVTPAAPMGIPGVYSPHVLSAGAPVSASSKP